MTIRKIGLLLPVFLLFLISACAKKPAQEPAADFSYETPAPSLTPRPTETPQPTPTPDPTPEPAPTPFSIVWITDTQYLVYEQDAYKELGEWIASQCDSENICYVVGTGDIVQTFDMEYQWDEFQKFRAAFQGKIPDLYIAGNHDMQLKDSTFGLFVDHIYGEGGTEEQSYHSGQGKYELFSAGGADWLIIGMSFGYGKEEAQWVKSVLDEYPDRNAILLFHDYLFRDGTLVKNAKAMFSVALEPSRNAKLVLCGHNTGFYIRTDEREGENAGYMQTIFCNRQSFERQNGCIQMLRIDTARGLIDFEYFSPINDRAKPVQHEIPIDIWLQKKDGK